MAPRAPSRGPSVHVRDAALRGPDYAWFDLPPRLPCTTCVRSSRSVPTLVTVYEQRNDGGDAHWADARRVLRTGWALSHPFWTESSKRSPLAALRFDADQTLLSDSWSSIRSMRSGRLRSPPPPGATAVGSPLSSEPHVPQSPLWKYAALFSYAGTRYCGWQRQKGLGRRWRPEHPGDDRGRAQADDDEEPYGVGERPHGQRRPRRRPVRAFRDAEKGMGPGYFTQRSQLAAAQRHPGALGPRPVRIGFPCPAQRREKTVQLLFSAGAVRGSASGVPYSYWIKKTLDLEAMNAALVHLRGEHDFKAVSSLRGAPPTRSERCVQEILEAEALIEPRTVSLRSRPRAHLVRVRLVGTGLSQADGAWDRGHASSDRRGKARSLVHPRDFGVGRPQCRRTYRAWARTVARARVVSRGRVWRWIRYVRILREHGNWSSCTFSLRLADLSRQPAIALGCDHARGPGSRSSSRLKRAPTWKAAAFRAWLYALLFHTAVAWWSAAY